MTRINLGIPPAKLIDQHLLAEYRELPRILTYVNKYANIKVPNNFTLGQGHVKFFANKLLYLHVRYKILHEELCKRGIELNNLLFLSVLQSFYISSNNLYNYYIPKKSDIKLIKERIENRIKTMKSEPRYFGAKITKQNAIELLSRLRGE